MTDEEKHLTLKSQLNSNEGKNTSTIGNETNQRRTETQKDADNTSLSTFTTQHNAYSKKKIKSDNANKTRSRHNRGKNFPEMQNTQTIFYQF